MIRSMYVENNFEFFISFIHLFPMNSYNHQMLCAVQNCVSLKFKLKTAANTKNDKELASIAQMRRCNLQVIFSSSFVLLVRVWRFGCLALLVIDGSRHPKGGPCKSLNNHFAGANFVNHSLAEILHVLL